MELHEWVDSEDQIFKKKTTEKDDQWRIEKDILSWTFGGVEKKWC